MTEAHAGNIGLLLCRQMQRGISFLFAYRLLLQLTERKGTVEYILYFGFLIGFSCQAGETQNIGTTASRERYMQP